MSAPYTGDDERIPAAVTLLDDGDLATPAAALWNVPDEAVIDGVASLVTEFGRPPMICAVWPWAA